MRTKANPWIALAWLALAALPVVAADIGYGLTEPPGPGWQGFDNNPDLFVNTTVGVKAIYCRDPNHVHTNLRQAGYRRTAHGWVMFKALAPPLAAPMKAAPAPPRATAPVERTDVGAGLRAPAATTAPAPQPLPATRSASIGRGLTEPPGPGWTKAKEDDDVWSYHGEGYLAFFLEDPSGSLKGLQADGYARTPRGWVKFSEPTPAPVPSFTAVAEAPKPASATIIPAPPPPLVSPPSADNGFEFVFKVFALCIGSAVLIGAGATASHLMLKGNYARQTKTMQEEYAALKAELLRRMNEMVETPTGLRVVKVSYGERIIVKFSLDPSVGRIRIDWTLKPEERRPLRVDIFSGPQNLLVSDFAACGDYTALWQPGDHPCRVRARASDQPENQADQVTYLLTVPTAAESADTIAKLKDAIARVGRFAGEGRAAVSKTERDLAEQWSREGLDEEEINKLLNTVRGATSRMFEEALSTLKKGK